MMSPGSPRRVAALAVYCGLFILLQNWGLTKHFSLVKGLKYSIKPTCFGI